MTLIVLKDASVFDISYDYLNLFYAGKEISVEEKRKVITDLYYLLDCGWTAEEIYINLNECIRRNELNIDLKTHFNKLRRNKTNLLKPNVMRYHNKLLLRPAPVVVEIDAEKGMFKKTKPEYFLEPIASFTSEDMADYLFSMKDICEPTLDKKRTIGAMEWTFNKIKDINLILYMMDAAFNYLKAHDLKLTAPTQINDYYSAAVDMLKNKKNDFKDGEVVYVPRKRMLFSRNRAMVE